jgi:hypothetical protein
MKLLLWLLFPIASGLVAVAIEPQAEVKRPELIGVVKGTDGQPISGASAFIYTAGPRLGIGFL